MLRTALITYHSAYNFGSVLQAFATQTAMEKLGYPVEIINYRMAEQNYFYQKLYRAKYGLKTAVKDLMMAPVQARRKERAGRYERFFAEYFQLSRKVSEPLEVTEFWNQYDLIVSGSDQIWNKHSCELEHNDWQCMDPYLLKGFNGRKISYASSVGNMTDTELQHILPELQQFDALAFRESVSAGKMAALLGRQVDTVLDPTFLLTKDEWSARFQLRRPSDKRYILVYSLGGPKKIVRLPPILSKLAEKRDCKVKLVTPFAYFPCLDKRIEYHPEYGPVEFLDALNNAEMVVTDSYHGTVLSVNFGKEFYSICKSGGAEFRKTDILNRLGLQDRIIHDAAEIPGLNLPSIDYTAVYAKLDILRQHSLNYLRSALES